MMIGCSSSDGFMNGAERTLKNGKKDVVVTGWLCTPHQGPLSHTLSLARKTCCSEITETSKKLENTYKLYFISLRVLFPYN